MRNFRFWLPTILGVLITPPLFYAAAVSTGAGHGSYGTAIVAYPLPVLVMFAGGGPFASETTETLFMSFIAGLAILQLPFYGFVLGYAHLKGTWWLLLVAGIICIHLIVIAIWLVIAGFMWATAAS